LRDESRLLLSDKSAQGAAETTEWVAVDEKLLKVLSALNRRDKTALARLSAAATAHIAVAVEDLGRQILPALRLTILLRVEALAVASLLDLFARAERL
jgi:hypothetical protein